MVFLMKGLSSAQELHSYFQQYMSKTNQLIFTAFLASIAAVLQAAGGFLPGVGYLISPFSTAPIVLCTIVSIRSGFMGYILTIVLLLILQPSEIIVFPFTTGLLGLGLGGAFLMLKQWISIIAAASLFLFAGINILMYGLRFPVLGPSVSSTFHVVTFASIYIFSALYSWLWVVITNGCMKKMHSILVK
ncbi:MULTISPECIES: hypothetical protein [unclassified Paenibacillus]|uniref:hypothetical protein n=1 Tax=unclassified Paenibacillus TaxID=185978 RepID=UPI00070A6461|nr:MULTISPECIES: hypothetical protein [unclassified Paenibacillus]KQX48558.1 hypothetical protein ASD40_10210 [Paenibacillus sp. Root444D2]KRE49837.1 hypothetical protein ASG85_23485 [Paenibacillus sp. Soil724D2]